MLQGCDVAMDAGLLVDAPDAGASSASTRPEVDDLDALLLAVFALAHPGDRQPGIAFELTKRLPLRRRNLTEPLLFDLCVRAFAKHASGQQTGAQRDLERVYSIDPGFPFVKIAQELMAPSNV